MTIDIDEQVKAISERKALVFSAETGPAKVKAVLTPVGTERKASIPDIPEVFLTAEAVRDIANDLRAQAATLIAVADGLDKYKPESATPVPAKLTAQAQRLEGDEPARLINNPPPTQFARDYAAKQASAQAATFKPEVILETTQADRDDAVDLMAEAVRIFDIEDAGSGSTVPGWVCPEHGSTDIHDLTSGKGRKYRACGICSKFEK